MNSLSLLTSVLNINLLEQNCRWKQLRETLALNRFLGKEQVSTFILDFSLDCSQGIGLFGRVSYFMMVILSATIHYTSLLIITMFAFYIGLHHNLENCKRILFFFLELGGLVRVLSWFGLKMILPLPSFSSCPFLLYHYL